MQPKPSRPSADEKVILQLFRRLSKAKQGEVLRVAEDMAADVKQDRPGKP